MEEKIKNGNKALTIKQQKFCDYYLQTGNATESAKMAGYSESTAHVIAYETLKKPYIKKYIEEQREEAHKRAVAKTDEILRFWSDVMRSEKVPTSLRLKASEYLGKAYDVKCAQDNGEYDKLTMLCNALQGVIGEEK